MSDLPRQTLSRAEADLRITFCCADTDAQPWLDGLRAAMPQADIQLWHSGAPLAQYAVVWAPPQAFFDEQTQLRAVFNIGAGVDALLRLRINPQVQLVRLDDAGMAVQMAEYVCHALLRHFREFDGYEADAGQAHWSARAPRVHADFPVGILGLGVLGQRVARAVQHFNFPVNGWSRTAKDIAGVHCFAGARELPQFLAQSRVLVCLLPLTADTADILNRNTLGQLRPDGYLINVARGGHLVEDDLLALLDSGHLAGATLDVFRTEPLPSGHRFWTHPKIRITPHISARTLRGQSIAQIAHKLDALENGQPLAGLVERSRGY